MPELFNKEGLATCSVARELCSIPLGERIPTVSELERSCGASRGNIQKALVNLKEGGAVALEAHGQNGTLLTGIDYLALAAACGVDHITGAMPLPYTLRYEGLATALFTLLNTGDIRAYITFQRGSEARVQTLLDGSTDYCVMSRLALDDYLGRGYPLVEALDCGPLSYVGRHVLLTRDPKRSDWSGARVGVDRSSVDQSTLTARYFADKDVELVDVQYTHIVDMLKTGALDAGIWNEDDLHVRAASVATSRLEGMAAQDGNTHAIVVVRKDDALMGRLIRRLATCEQVRSIQRKVMENELPARY
ncbi:GntR family transcriptional regulator YhfZ [Olsenella sp. HMSC062G07]|uniref:GntR family transcriptional regulator YhfZ n=1 Tax=Olsenella sp. HMSC062G07 TaxID=1739330 RepID=UPI0008C83B1A|nr:GntR family transcriptional regulator YhfZ [Olsenella sp. HMSC062G07]OFK23647.1 hypothetical protein HMPREF2826_03885 [Olsenella sp. HMSC062G07]